ncbi:zinc finger BED domain-containing protein 1-like [Sitophilus oryzae]|uniref:Zinc finger BED domain-containing protein 1-like n=1 Tax=Sitophilus oryzae TaxID=7048 RepID=A0A6J2YC96_SITOR|nr:zinc finger BED domain-containing protein 1-like [Sitophilus oryzae]
MEKFLNISRKSSSKPNHKTGTGEPTTETVVDLVDPGESSISDTDSFHTGGPRAENEKPNKRQKISKVWKFFKRSSDKKLAKCLDCGKEYKTSGNTSNLNDHLNRFHPNLLRNIPVDSEFGDDCPSTFAGSNTRSSSRSVSPFFRRQIEYSDNSLRKKQLDNALTLMIASDFQPFNIVNDTGFRIFVNLMDPRDVLPSKFTIREKIMKQIYDDSHQMLKDILKNVKYVAITSDSWSSRATESYLTVTCHFVSSNFELKSAVLSTKPLENGVNHTAENISCALKDLFVEWGIENKISGIVTDNAANMMKACDLLKKKSLPCFAHTINLVVQDTISISPLKDVLIKCKEIVRFMKSSNIAADMFKKEQDTATPYKLIQEVSTRWNSAFQMVKRIVQTSDALNKTLLKIPRAPQPLAAEEIIILKEVVDVLACFEEATTKVSGTKYVTISFVIPIVQGIHNTLEKKFSEMQTDEGRQICLKLQESVRKRLFLFEKRTIPQMGTLLDPRFKQDGFRNDDNIKSALHFMEQEMSYVEKNEKEVTSISSDLIKESSEGTSSSFLGSSSLFSFMDSKIQQRIKSTTAGVIIMKRQYKAL